MRAVDGGRRPDGGTEEKPVGTVYLGLTGPSGTSVRRFQFPGDRAWVRTLSCQNALDMLRLELIK